MLQLQGIPVSPGIAIGKASVFNSEGRQVTVSYCTAETAPNELAHLSEAVKIASRDIQESRDSVSGSVGGQYGAIFDAHLVMLRDQKLFDSMQDAILKEHFSAEYAVHKTLHSYAQIFQNIQDPFMAERANDILDLEKRILRVLQKEKRQIQQFTEPVVLFARNFTPSETVAMNTDFVQAFATEIGGPSSHTAIVAEALRIPAVVGIGSFIDRVEDGCLAIVDGSAGVIVLDPDEETLERYIRLQAEKQTLGSQLATLRELPAVTLDGTEVQILGNIEFPKEAEACVDAGADGIGLYRTEFLYLGGDVPTEEEHFQAYKHVLETMGDKPVTIRTVDLGADKMVDALSATANGKQQQKVGYCLDEDEKNPALGLRSIRLSLKRTELFTKQLRAILRAGKYGNVQVMFPLVSTIAEWRQAKMILEDVKEDLYDRDIDFAENIPLGVMVEVPSTVLMIDRFANECDFLSVGTNDLTQYTLAVDRTNKDVVYLYNSTDPVILRLLDITIRASNRARKPVSVCGRMSSDPRCAMLLLGLGLRKFSVSPAAIPEVKNVIRKVNIAQCRVIAKRALEMESAAEVNHYIWREHLKLFPELGEF